MTNAFGNFARKLGRVKRIYILASRSPDLTNLALYFLGHVKDYVSTPPTPPSMEKLRGRISDAISRVDVSAQLDRILVSGGHFPCNS